MIRILVKFNDAVLKEIESDKEEVTIGRNKENDIQIENLAVSGRHARIKRHRNDYFIEDLNSTNGTFVNEKRISTEVLKNSDAVTIGKHTLFVLFEKGKKGHQGLDIRQNEMNKTMKLDTRRHKEMIKKQR
jgi:pSer/pThr/pTyr-binding forkhead associated (FHA) protein